MTNARHNDRLKATWVTEKGTKKYETNETLSKEEVFSLKKKCNYFKCRNIVTNNKRYKRERGKINEWRDWLWVTNSKKKLRRMT